MNGASSLRCNSPQFCMSHHSEPTSSCHSLLASVAYSHVAKFHDVRCGRSTMENAPLNTDASDDVEVRCHARVSAGRPPSERSLHTCTLMSVEGARVAYLYGKHAASTRRRVRSEQGAAPACMLKACCSPCFKSTLMHGPTCMLLVMCCTHRHTG
eukprot:6188929-Pleurochrysis_carterae.AAC.2